MWPRKERRRVFEKRRGVERSRRRGERDAGKPGRGEGDRTGRFAEETLKMIGMTKDILNGKDYGEETVRSDEVSGIRGVSEVLVREVPISTREVVLRVREHVERASEGWVSDFHVE